MASEVRVARESGARPLNAVSLSKRRLQGWNNTYQPKNQSVEVLGWLRENDLYVSNSDADYLEGTRFRDILRGKNYDNVETLLRDAIYDGAQSLKKR